MAASEKLIACCEDIFKKMKKFYESHQQSCTGFNFSYSPKKSWEAMPNVLLLTDHPHPHKGETPQPSPDSPWHEKGKEKENDFFDRTQWEDLLFPERILTIAAEIAACKQGIAYEASMDSTELEKFVDRDMVLASFVPFRTTNPRQQDLVKFSKEDYWGEIWQRWQPELIITAGVYPFGRTGRVLKQLGWNVQVIIEAPTWKFGIRKDKQIPFSQGHYKIYSYTNESLGKQIYVLSVPSPSANYATKENANTNYGYQDPRLYVPNLSPIQDFIRKALFFIQMQRA